MNRAAQIEKDFRSWVMAQTGFAADRVIFDNQNGPRPERPYITIGDVTGWQKAQMVDSQEPVPGGDADQLRIRGRRTKIFQVDCYSTVECGVNPQHVLESLRDSIDDPQVFELQHRQGWALQDQSDVTDLTELRDTKYEPRAMIEFTVAAEFIRDTRPGYIEKVDVVGTLGSQTRNISGPN